MHAFFSELVSYLIEFVFLIAVACGGVYTGKKMALKKKAKKQDA